MLRHQTDFMYTPPLQFNLYVFYSGNGYLPYLISNNYFYSLPQFKSSAFFDLSVKTLPLPGNTALIRYFLNNLSLFTKLTVLRMQFTGKGYRSYLSSRYTLTFSFGFSHVYYIYNYTLVIKQLTKTKLIFIALDGTLLGYKA